MEWRRAVKKIREKSFSRTAVSRREHVVEAGKHQPDFRNCQDHDAMEVMGSG
jgi:hypothetical protein